MRISSEILISTDADAFSLAEGSILQRPLWRGRAGVARVPSPGHVSKGIVQGTEEQLHPSFRTERNASHIGRSCNPRVDRRGSRRDGEQSYDPIVPVKGGEPQGFRKERPRNPLEGRGKQATHLLKET